MDPHSLAKEIKKQARLLGFELCGITTPTPPPHIDTFKTWLEKGYHAGMTWMATDRAKNLRENPIEILPECKSVLVLGIRYPRPTLSISGKKAQLPQVASYAWGEDYHEILPDRLHKIVTFIKGMTGKEIPNRWYTDTGPILERELAQQAGLGWIGKNTCLINPSSGSYFLLAEIFLGIELEITQPFITDYCGSCNRCVENCPTGCITPERTIDSNRCISYHTIENKGSIPIEIRPLIRNWIFGCDVCQIVCPWNVKFAHSALDPAFTPRPGIPPPNLIDEFNLTPDLFNRKFKGNPIKRAKRRGYLRNAAIVFGNLGDRNAIPVLCAALNDPEPLIRGHAAWALGQIGGEKPRHALTQADQSESHPEVKTEIINALKQT